MIAYPDPISDKKQRIAKAKKQFTTNLILYCIIIPLLFVISMGGGIGVGIFLIPAAGYGIVLLIRYEKIRQAEASNTSDSDIKSPLYFNQAIEDYLELKALKEEEEKPKWREDDLV